MTNRPLVLTCDFGTQSVRASIFDEKGNALASEKEVYAPAYYSKQPGWAEQDPSYYFDCLVACTKRLRASSPEVMTQVKAVTMTCFRDSAVLLDQDRNVIRPMILWLDQRLAKCENRLPWSARFIFALVHKTETINQNRRRTVANWIIENEPENWAKCDKYVSISTYFIYRLTGELKDCASDFTGHYPINYPKKAWYPDPMKDLQGQCFSIRKEQLCELLPSQAKVGEITEKASETTGIPVGTPMFLAGSDKSCETLGMGIIDDRMAAISLGTACTIETVTKKYIHPYPLLPSYPCVLPEFYNLDHQIYRGYWMINWFVKYFCAKPVEDLMSDDNDIEEFNKRLFDIPAGSDGLIIQPYWGSQLEKPEVKGMMIGFSDFTTREHVYKSIIEGINYELFQAMENFEKKVGHPFEGLRISGGGSRSDEVCQIAADMFNKKVSKVQTNETSSLGAAISGFLSLGVYSSAKEAVDAMVRESVSFVPDPKNHAIYEQLFRNVYVKLYPSLKDSYKYLFHYNAR